jgi:DNA-binding GntR family transcriptional regulator
LRRTEQLERKKTAGESRLASSEMAVRGTAPSPELGNLDDQIFVRIKTMIVNGALLPGERIVPEQLARKMGVSRTPLLSALKRLSQEHLITWRSRRGAFVRRLSKRELAMIFEVREVLEGLAARRAAALITPHQLRRLRDLFAGIDTTDTPANRRAYLSRDYLFHAGILEIAGSPPLTETTHSVNILVLAFGAGLIKSIQDGLAEHAAIFDALERHDPEAAEAAMRAHIHRSAVWLHHEADLFERPEDLPPGHPGHILTAAPVSSDFVLERTTGDD